MKKKGLIIATIVMVLVLAVSLTTATYAWFTASSSTKVDKIDLTINAANIVSIGARATTGASNTQDDYMYETVTLGHGNAGAATANDPTFTGGTVGLGTTLGFSTATTLNLSTAVNTATSVTPAVYSGSPATLQTTGEVDGVDATFNPAHYVYKANAGENPTTHQLDDEYINTDSIDYANANEDYVVLKMGAQAAKQGVKGIYATVTVKTTDTATTLRMMAAMHFYIKVGNTHAEFDLFGTNNHQNTQKKSIVGTGLTSGVTVTAGTNEDPQASATFSFLIAGANNASGEDLAYDGSAISQFEIYSYVWGPDSDCISTATGCGASIDIEFFGVTADSTFSGTFITLA